MNTWSIRQFDSFETHNFFLSVLCWNYSERLPLRSYNQIECRQFKSSRKLYSKQATATATNKTTNRKKDNNDVVDDDDEKKNFQEFL